MHSVDARVLLKQRLCGWWFPAGGWLQTLFVAGICETIGFLVGA